MFDDEALVLSVDGAEWNGSYEGAGGERSLLAAVLTQALSDVKSTGERARSAVRFFLSEDDYDVFSFHSICSYLSIDPVRVLQVTGLLARAQRKQG